MESTVRKHTMCNVAYYSVLTMYARLWGQFYKVGSVIISIISKQNTSNLPNVTQKKLWNDFVFIRVTPTAWGGFPGGSEVKASPCNVGDLGLIPGEGNGNPLQYSCLENPMDGGVWRATVHGVVKSRTRLSDFTFTFLQHDYSCIQLLGIGRVLSAVLYS